MVVGLGISDQDPSVGGCDSLSAPAQYIRVTIVVYRAPPPSARQRVLRVRLSREAAATESLIDS